MYKPLALYIGLRYTKAKRRNHFISFISIVSMVGIALGITVLITVLSVMNGFDQEIKKRVFSMVPPISITSASDALINWQPLQQKLRKLPQVTGSAPYVAGEVLMNNGDSNQPAILSGIFPEQEKEVSQIASKVVRGHLNNLKAGQFGIVLGEDLANSLMANLGDKVTVMTTQVSLTPAGALPRFKRFTVVGVFRAGNGFGFDRGLAFIHINDAQKLLRLGNRVTGIHLNIQNVFSAPNMVPSLIYDLPTGVNVGTWADQFGEFFQAIKLEKTMMFFILFLIIAVAAFNLVSTLMMVVSEKESDIAILRTMGASRKLIMHIFIIQGCFIGLIGTLLGLVGGLLLASNATTIVNWIEHVFHVQFLQSNLYFVNYLPSKIELNDVLVICCASLILSFLATIYPAWRASAFDPVESLRYE